MTTVASGSSSVRSASTASSRSRRSPLVATITGSTTSVEMPCSRTFAATTRMISEFEIMPVFTASAPMSVTTASIWAATISGGISWTAVTPSVFWAVIAVSADIPNTPSAENVFRSA